MTDARGAHSDAVDAAIHAVGEVEEMLSATTDRTDSLMGAVIHATGSNPWVESAQNAMNFTAEIKNRIEEIYRIAEGVKAELERYKGGF